MILMISILMLGVLFCVFKEIHVLYDAYSIAYLRMDVVVSYMKTQFTAVIERKSLK